MGAVVTTNPIPQAACVDPRGAGASWSAPLLAGDAGTAQTIALIRASVEEAWRDPLIRATAGRLIARLSPSDTRGQAQAIFDWVVSRIRFVRDPVGHETVSSARWTLTNGFGDCDDINAVLLPSLLGAVGIHARLVTIGDERNFTHVYAEALADGEWIPLDAARPNPQFGRAPEHGDRRRIWELESAEFRDVAGLGQFFPPGGITSLPGIFGDGAAGVINFGIANLPNIIGAIKGRGGVQTGGAAGAVITTPRGTYTGSVFGQGYTLGQIAPWLIGGLALLLLVKR